MPLQLGYSINKRHSNVAKTSNIREPPAGYQTDNESLKLLIDRVIAFREKVYQGIKDTEKSDAPTSNQLQDLACQVDKNLWQSSILLKKLGSLREDLPWKDKQERDRATDE